MIRGLLENMGRLGGDVYWGTAVVPTSTDSWILPARAEHAVPISGLRA